MRCFRKKQIMALSGSVLLMVDGCSPPATYSTDPHAPPSQYTLGGYRPLITNSNRFNRSSFTVKTGFIILLYDICPPNNAKPDERDTAGPCKDKTDVTDFACWAVRHPNVRKCADAITIHAVNQCITLAGYQNSFAAKVEQWLFPIQSIAGLMADILAIRSANSNNTTGTAALAAAILSNSAAVQRTAGSNATVKVSDLAQTEQSFLLLSGFQDDDVRNREIFKFDTIEKFSDLHDAVLTTCPANNA